MALTWRDDDWGHETQVSFSLSPIGDDRSTLRLEHKGWAVFPPEMRQALVERHMDGWTYHLRSLLGYLLRQAGTL